MTDIDVLCETTSCEADCADVTDYGNFVDDFPHDSVVGRPSTISSSNRRHDKKLDSTNLSSTTDANHFVNVVGRQFTLGEKPYYFLGSNFSNAAHLDPSCDGERTHLQGELNLLQAHGIGNLRVAASPVFTHTNMDEMEDERFMQGLDFLLSELAERGMKAVLYFRDSYSRRQKDEQVCSKKHEWCSRLYFHDIAHQRYREYIYSLLMRSNTYTGVEYRNDATIMSWELADGLQSGSTAYGANDNYLIFKYWVDSTAEFIRSIDRKHLISTGCEGVAGTLGQDALFMDCHSGPHIDYLAFQFSLEKYLPTLSEKGNWSVGGVSSASEEQLDPVIRHVSLANRIRKPIVLASLGFDVLESGLGDYRLEFRLARRNGGMRKYLEQFLGQAKLGRSAAGVHLGSPSRGGADTPGELFTRDGSALHLIKRYTKKFDMLSIGYSSA